MHVWRLTMAGQESTYKCASDCHRTKCSALSDDQMAPWQWWCPWLFLWYYDYCSISFNSAGPVTRYRPAEILVSALSEFGRDKARNSAVQRRRPQKFTMLRLWSPNGFGTGKNCPLQPLHFGKFEGRVTRYCRIEWNSTVLVFWPTVAWSHSGRQ